MSVLCFFLFYIHSILADGFYFTHPFSPLPPILLACVISIPSDLLQKPEKIFINVSILSYSSASWVFQSSKIKKTFVSNIWASIQQHMLYKVCPCFQQAITKHSATLCGGCSCAFICLLISTLENLILHNINKFIQITLL